MYWIYGKNHQSGNLSPHIHRVAVDPAALPPQVFNINFNPVDARLGRDVGTYIMVVPGAEGLAIL